MRIELCLLQHERDLSTFPAGISIGIRERNDTQPALDRGPWVKVPGLSFR